MFNIFQGLNDFKIYRLYTSTNTREEDAQKIMHHYIISKENQKEF